MFLWRVLSLVPRLSHMHVNKKLKGEGENLVKFDHVGNVIGRIIVDEQLNLLPKQASTN